MISEVSSRLFQPYIHPVPQAIHDGAPESAPFLKLPDIPSGRFADLCSHRDFAAIKAQFLADIEEMDKLAKGFVGDVYMGAIQTFRNNINHPPVTFENGMFPIFDQTRHQIHKIVGRMKVLSREPASLADSTPERDRMVLALHACLHEIDHCPAGVQSRFARAYRGLEAKPEQLDARLFLIRKTLLEEFSNTFLRQAVQDGVMSIQPGDEIHWVNALFNSVCSQFGLDAIPDPLATRKIGANVQESFQAELPRVLSEYTVLHTLASDYYQRFCHFLAQKKLCHWRTENIPPWELTSNYTEELEQAILTPLNQLCGVKEEERAISLTTLIEEHGDQYSFARCREKIHGWLTQAIIDTPATLFTRIPRNPGRPNKCVGTYNNLSFWVFAAECPLAIGAVCPFDAEESKPLTISDLSTIDVLSWPEDVQLALLGQATEQSGIMPSDARDIAAFLVGKGSGRALECYPANVQKTVADQLTAKMAVSPAFASKLVAELGPSFTESIPDWIFKTPLLEQLLVGQHVEERVIRAATDKLSIWHLITFSPLSLKGLFTPERCQELFRLALNRELGGLMWRLLQTGHCDDMNNHINPKSLSVLMVLCRQGVADGVDYLVNFLQDTDINSKSTNGHTALHIAVDCGQTKCLEKLLAIDNIALNEKSNKGSTALHIAARHGHAECLNMLLARDGIALNDKTNDDWTALHLAARYGHAECLNMLLARDGIALNDTTNDGWTALHIAARYGYNECLKELLAMDNIALNRASNNGLTALHFASGNDQTECLQQLLQMPSIRVNSKDYRGYTPLMMAADGGYTDCIQLLLNHGDTALNMLDFYGVSAQHIARAHQHLDIVDVLERDPRYNRWLNSCLWYLCCCGSGL